MSRMVVDDAFFTVNEVAKPGNSVHGLPTGVSLNNQLMILFKKSRSNLGDGFPELVLNIGTPPTNTTNTFFVKLE
jgi:hypothetical protein